LTASTDWKTREKDTREAVQSRGAAHTGPQRHSELIEETNAGSPRPLRGGNHGNRRDGHQACVFWGRAWARNFSRTMHQARPDRPQICDGQQGLG